MPVQNSYRFNLIDLSGVNLFWKDYQNVFGFRFVNQSSPCVQLVKWDQLSFASAVGPAAVELLASGLDGYANQANRVEELFEKIWPPPNVWSAIFCC